MRFRPSLNALETRDNPSGPELLDPTNSLIAANAAPLPVATPTPAEAIAAAEAAAAAAAAAAAGLFDSLALWGR